MHDLLANKLSMDGFKSVFQEHPTQTSKPHEIILYIIGGTCIEESVAINDLNSLIPGVNIILGGTCLLTNQGFLENLISAN